MFLGWYADENLQGALIVTSSIQIYMNLIRPCATYGKLMDSCKPKKYRPTQALHLFQSTERDILSCLINFIQRFYLGASIGRI